MLLRFLIGWYGIRRSERELGVRLFRVRHLNIIYISYKGSNLLLDPLKDRETSVVSC